MYLAHEFQTTVGHIAQLNADVEMKEASKYDSDSDAGDSDNDSDYCEEEEEGWWKEWSGIALKTGSAGKTSPPSQHALLHGVHEMYHAGYSGSDAGTADNHD